MASLNSGRGTPRQRAQVIWELRHEFKLSLLLEIAELPRSTYYYYIKHMKDEDKDNEIRKQITDIFHENKGRYGYRRITMEMHNRGYVINHKTVLRLMNEEKIKCMVRIKKYRSYKGEVGKVAPNLLERDFSTSAPNEKWVTDVTKFSLFGRKLYLSPILHSDQGWQYQHKQYQKLLKDHSIKQSMSRKSNCLDNAVIENFFGLVKSALLYMKEFNSMDQFKAELIEYLDYYNNRRIKAKLKGLPPAVHRKQALEVA